MILIAGGENDFNLQNIIQRCEEQGIETCLLLTAEKDVPQITWHLLEDKLIINGKTVCPQAVFIRQDVFSTPYEKATVWYEMMRSWMFSHTSATCFNREYIGMNKAYNLLQAHRVGLRIPETVISNYHNILVMLDTSAYIVKPAIGGAYTVTLEQYMEEKDKETPVFIQNKLISPEIRIFGIGTALFAFRLTSTMLDYRVDNATKIEFVEVPQAVGTKQLELMSKLCMNFCAVDYKTDPNNNELVFLEINSSPMFGAFDQVSENAISKAMVKFLTI